MPSSRRRSFLVVAVSAGLLVGLAGALGAGCGSSGNADDRCALKGEGCDCEYEGQTVECADTVSISGDSLNCLAGTRTCTGGHWGACVGDHSTFQSMPKFSTQSATPSPCTTNPCDPGCMTFTESPTDIDGGTVSTGDGGLTLAEGGDAAKSDAAPCTGIACNIDSCGGDYTKTQVTGKVYDPAGKNPIYNVLVYVPNSTVTALTDGVSCAPCSAGSGSPIVSALTDYAGTFTLKGVPTGTNIPIVVQSGKWRRQLTIPTVTKCVSNSTASLTGSDGLPLIRFPKNRSEGDIPRIAFVSGSADPFQCVISKMGMDVSAASSEVGVSTVTGVATTLITNGTFEAATLTGWTPAGAFAAPSTAKFHGGAQAVQLGNPLAASTDNSVAQTFTAPALGGQLTFWYLSVCKSSTASDWLTATLVDNTTSGTTTVVGKTCTNTGTWVQASTALTAGHNYTLTLANHDSLATNFTYSYFDDVAITATGFNPARIHYYQGTNSAGQDLSATLGGGAPSANTLYDTAAHLDQYDAVILSCEGNEYNKGATINQNLVDYATLGGRIFATHYSYAYLQFAAAASQWPNVVKFWNHTSNPTDPMTTIINQTFPKGDNFAKWLNFTGASPTLGRLAIQEGRHDYDYVDPTRATPWMYSNGSGAPPTPLAPAGSDCIANSDCASNVCLAVTSTSAIANGDFETGLTSWTGTGAVVTTSTTTHGGTKSMQLGNASPGFDNSATQTFTAPVAASSLSFWYRNVCTDSVAYDWATATLKDNTTGTTVTVLPKTCTNTGLWQQITAALVSSHSYTLTLANHDDNYAGDPTYTLYDDVAVKLDGACTAPTPCTVDSDCGAATGAACWNGTCIPGHNMEALMTFNVPVGAAPASQCGRIVYSDFHVSASALGGGGTTFPTGCNGGDLSAQEKALEFMLFDLTSCITPDYVPPPPPPKYSPATATRDYVATCAAGYKIQWHFFDWMTHTPGDSSIAFSIQTGDTAAAVSAMTPLPLYTVTGAPVTTWTGKDVALVLGATTPATKHGSILRVTMNLNPTSDGLQAPVLDAWRQAYTCVPNE